MRRRKPTKLGAIGSVLVGAGVIFLVWGSLDHFRPNVLGVQLSLFGLILIIFKRLEAKNLAADEIFNLGRESGEGDGYDQGYEDGLVEGERRRPRPVVVPFAKCTCGNSECIQPVGTVADRV